MMLCYNMNTVWGSELAVKFDFRPSELEKMKNIEKCGKNHARNIFTISHFLSQKKCPELIFLDFLFHICL